MNTLLDVFLAGSISSLEETPQVLAGQSANLDTDGEDGHGTADALMLKHGSALPTHGLSPLSQSRERGRAPSEPPR